MTYSKLLGYGLLLAAFLVFLKTLFFGSFAWNGALGLHLFYWILVVVVTTALVRRLGVITLLEAVLVLVVWLFLELLGDALFAGPIAGYSVFTDPSMLFGYALLPISIILFHKKRHVQRRKDSSAH